MTNPEKFCMAGVMGWPVMHSRAPLMHNYWMKQALIQADKAFKSEEIPVGAVVIKEDKVIGRAYNQREQLNDPTAHAEIIAITAAANTLGDWRLNGCTLYVTKEPCSMCA